MRVTAKSPRFGPVDSAGSPMVPPRVLATHRGQPRSPRFDLDSIRRSDALVGSIRFRSYLAESPTLAKTRIINRIRYLAGICPISYIMLTFRFKPLFSQSNQSVSYELVATLTRSFRLARDDRSTARSTPRSTPTPTRTYTYPLQARRGSTVPG